LQEYSLLRFCKDLFKTSKIENWVSVSNVERIFFLNSHRVDAPKEQPIQAIDRVRQRKLRCGAELVMHVRANMLVLHHRDATRMYFLNNRVDRGSINYAGVVVHIAPGQNFYLTVMCRVIRQKVCK